MTESRLRPYLKSPQEIPGVLREKQKAGEKPPFDPREIHHLRLKRLTELHQQPNSPEKTASLNMLEDAIWSEPVTLNFTPLDIVMPPGTSDGTTHTWWQGVNNGTNPTVALDLASYYRAKKTRFPDDSVYYDHLPLKITLRDEQSLNLPTAAQDGTWLPDLHLTTDLQTQETQLEMELARLFALDAPSRLAVRLEVSQVPLYLTFNHFKDITDLPEDYTGDEYAACHHYQVTVNDLELSYWEAQLPPQEITSQLPPMALQLLVVSLVKKHLTEQPQPSSLVESRNQFVTAAQRLYEVIQLRDGRNLNTHFNQSFFYSDSAFLEPDEDHEFGLFQKLFEEMVQTPTLQAVRDYYYDRNPQELTREERRVEHQKFLKRDEQGRPYQGLIRALLFDVAYEQHKSVAQLKDDDRDQVNGDVMALHGFELVWVLEAPTETELLDRALIVLKQHRKLRNNALRTPFSPLLRLLLDVPQKPLPGLNFRFDHFLLKHFYPDLKVSLPRAIQALQNWQLEADDLYREAKAKVSLTKRTTATNDSANNDELRADFSDSPLPRQNQDE
jgi:hypothetical protein